MRPFLPLKVALVILAVLVLAGVGALVFVSLSREKPEQLPIETQKSGPTSEVIGTSVEGRAITAYTYGNGSTKLLFVGGMHGGYEWNAVLLAYQFIDYLNANSTAVPANLSVIVIPSLNPDGLFKVVGKEGHFTLADVSSDKTINEAGRFNAHSVDLNRNFDCNWQATSTWKAKLVSGGTAAFSEPEARALRDFVLKNHIDAAIFWHSQANAVYASECNAGILPGTLDLMNAYASAAKYPAIKSFDAYPITGDSEGWLASINIPAITVELQTHETVEWDRNLAGIKALFLLYSH